MSQSSILGGYAIPKGAVVLLNTLSMHFDPNEWDDPQSFKAGKKKKSEYYFLVFYKLL